MQLIDGQWMDVQLIQIAGDIAETDCCDIVDNWSRFPMSARFELGEIIAINHRYFSVGDFAF
ncbi:MAG: hypothetical protein R2733_18075 [Acidimicrobiales bacterium]